MPGRRRKSFRSGDMAEDFGLSLMRGIAAVAEVPRTEDFGMDAVANLHRLDDDGNVYAEDSFIVQLKASSTKQVPYEDHELTWLLEQKLPMFIGLVALDRASISLYPTIRINQAVFAIETTRVSARFGRFKMPDFLAGQDHYGWKKDQDGGLTVWLGDPLLEWTIGDVVDSEWTHQAYKTLKRYICFADRELHLLSLGQSSPIVWSTNDETSIQSSSIMMKGSPSDLQQIATACVPCLRSLMLRAVFEPSAASNSLMNSLIALVESLRELGAEIDRDKLFDKMQFIQSLRANIREEMNDDG